jgi:hypothetical protein
MIPLSAKINLLNIKVFVPFTPKPVVDEVANNMKAVGITDEVQIKEFKSILKELKESLDNKDNKEIISLDIFKKLSTL